MNRSQIPPFTVEPAQEHDLPAILDLLVRTNLPPDGLRQHVNTALVARLDGEVVGSAALEHYRDAALLRSVAVAPPMQGRGLGCRLTETALQLARDLGVTQVYLLTETAAEFFPRFGFGVVDRAQVPPAVRRSVEFTSACPESALAMTLVLK